MREAYVVMECVLAPRAAGRPDRVAYRPRYVCEDEGMAAAARDGCTEATGLPARVAVAEVLEVPHGER